MNVSIHRVDEDKLQREKEDMVAEGWKPISESDRTVVLHKDGGVGSAGTHLIVAILTVWWTFGLGNLLYLIYKKYGCIEELRLKVE